MNKNSIAKKVNVVSKLKSLGAVVPDDFLYTTDPTMDKNGKPIPGSQYWTKLNSCSRRLTKLCSKAKLVKEGNPFDPDTKPRVKALKGGYEVTLKTKYQKREIELDKAKKELKRYGITLKEA